MEIFWQLHWLPFFGLIVSGIIVRLEYRSCLGLFSPSGLTSFYAFIKFGAECLVISNFDEYVALASNYGVSDPKYISQAILISFVVTLLSYVVLWLGTFTLRRPYSHCAGEMYRVAFQAEHKIGKNRWSVSGTSLKFFGLLILGIALLFVIFQSAGGIIFFFSNLAQRTEMLSGYGAVLKFSTVFIQLAFLYFFVTYYETSRLKAFTILCVGLLVLFTLGARTAPVFLIFMSLVYLHFYRQKFHITLRFMLGIGLIFVAALSISLLRFSNLDSILGSGLSAIPFGFWITIIGGYFVRFIRDSVIVSYFSDNEFWLGSGFLSFFYSFIPRALYPEKPVIDNGIYVIAMSSGQQVMPPMSPDVLPHYGWPEGYMSGFMEGGWIGLCVGVILSCCLVNFIFSRLVSSGFKIEWIFLYSMFIFRSPLYLSSIALFDIVFHGVVVLSISFLIRKKFIFRPLN